MHILFLFMHKACNQFIQKHVARLSWLDLFEYLYLASKLVSRIEKQAIELRIRKLLVEQACDDTWICRGCFNIYRLGVFCPKTKCVGMSIYIYI